jgi:hypothetical protein
VAKHGKSQLAIRGLIDAILSSRKVQARHHNGSALYITSKPRSLYSTTNSNLHGSALRNPLTWLRLTSPDLYGLAAALWLFFPIRKMQALRPELGEERIGISITATSKLCVTWYTAVAKMAIKRLPSTSTSQANREDVDGDEGWTSATRDQVHDV